MTGTMLVYRDDGVRPHCEIALSGGDRVQLALDAAGLVIERLAGDGRSAELLFKAPPKIVSRLCAGLVGPKERTEAPPLRILAATVQRIGTAADVKAAFKAAVASL